MTKGSDLGINKELLFSAIKSAALTRQEKIILHGQFFNQLQQEKITEKMIETEDVNGQVQLNETELIQIKNHKPVSAITSKVEKVKY